MRRNKKMCFQHLEYNCFDYDYILKYIVYHVHSSVNEAGEHGRCQRVTPNE